MLIVTATFDLGLRCGPDGLEPCRYSDTDAIAFGEFEADVYCEHEELMFDQIRSCETDALVTGPFRSDVETYLTYDHPTFVADALEQIAEEQADHEADYRLEQRRDG